MGHVATAMLVGCHNEYGSTIDEVNTTMSGTAANADDSATTNAPANVGVSRGSKRFHELLDEIGALHDRKQADYGRPLDPFANVRASTEWGVPAWVGAMVRATDKLRRLQTFAQRGTLANEGVADSLKDLAVYSLIALVLFEEADSDSNV